MKGLNSMDCIYQSDTDTLRNLMYNEARACKLCADLACRRCASRSADTLRQIANEESCHLRKLQAEYFILTGSTYAPCVADLDIPCNYLEAMRQCFFEKKQCAGAYLDAAATTSDPRLAAICTELADCEAQNANCIAKLISDYMCGR